jgi:hypothetical protein
MTVRFNVDTDLRFRDSLESLPKSDAIAVLSTLEDLAKANVPWTTFVETSGWEALPIAAPDTYPGANLLHSFFIELAGNKLIEIVGYTYDEIVVICAIARWA